MWIEVRKEIKRWKRNDRKTLKVCVCFPFSAGSRKLSFAPLADPRELSLTLWDWKVNWVISLLTPWLPLHSWAAEGWSSGQHHFLPGIYAQMFAWEIIDRLLSEESLSFPGAQSILETHNSLPDHAKVRIASCSSCREISVPLGRWRWWGEILQGA